MKTQTKIVLKKAPWFTVITALCFVVVTLFVASGCDKSETPPITCIVDNPVTDLPWLKEIVDGFEYDAVTLGYNPQARIYQCTYKDGIGFLLEMCVGCPDAGYSFRNCEGVILCGGGGHSGEDNCSEWNINSENKKLIWEMENSQIKPQELCHCIMDTLKGEWNWIRVEDGKGNTWDNEFTSIIKILSQNEDKSINYGIFVDDTLFSKGSFQILEVLPVNEFCVKIAYINLPHLARRDGKQYIFVDWWYLVSQDWLTGESNEEILVFVDGRVPDVVGTIYSYVYQKMK